MSYTITQTDGTIILQLPDGTADGPDVNPGLNRTDINLIGKNYATYGLIQNENFIKLLQNFSYDTPPLNPLIGQLWYDTSDSFLKVYSGSVWSAVSPLTVGDTAPSPAVTGAEWWDTVNYQLKMFNGSNWTTIGPGYSYLDGISGAIVESILDTLSATHVVIKMYIKGVVTSIISNDAAFTPAVALTGFSTIQTGINMSTACSGIFIGTATNSQNLGNIAPANYARNDITSVFAANLYIGGGNLTFKSATSGAASISNPVLNANVTVYNNVGGVTTPTLNINGANGLITVVGDPVSAKGVATKNYVDNNIATAVAPLAPLDSPVLTGTPTATTTLITDNSTRIATTAFTQATIADSLLILSQYARNDVNSSFAANINIGGGRLVFNSAVGSASISNTVLNANVIIYSNVGGTSTPTLTINGSTGLITVVGDPTTNFGVATKKYVDDSIGTAVAPLAPLDSPVLTGTPTATTPATVNDSTRIATTAFTKAAITDSLTILSQYARNDIDSSFAANINIGGGKLTFKSTPSGIASINNTVLNAGVTVYNNVGGTSTPTLTINGSTGLITVVGNPTTEYGVATKKYVDDGINNAVSPLAPKLDPSLTGIPLSTTPATSDDSTRIATTAFTKAAIAASTLSLWQGSHQFVSTVTPTALDGAVGDFWFQI
jgi:hypothetical protein